MKLAFVCTAVTAAIAAALGALLFEAASRDMDALHQGPAPSRIKAVRS